MYYELYIDVFFLVNFMLDVFVLMLVKSCMKYQTSILRIMLAAALGSGGLCIFLLLPVRNRIGVQLLFYVVIYSAMVLVGFHIKSIRGFLRCLIILYAVSFLVSGIYTGIARKIQGFSKLFLSSMAIYWLIRIVIKLFKIISAGQCNIYPVRIIHKGAIVDMKGLWDTGNQLHSPYNRKGVSIVGYEDVCSYLQKDVLDKLNMYLQQGVNTYQKEQITDEIPDEEPVMLIPYRTIGNQHGLLPVIEVDNICIQKDGEVLEYPKALIGISKEKVTKSANYQMILTTDG